MSLFNWLKTDLVLFLVFFLILFGLHMTVEFHKNQILIGMLHTFNPSIWEAEAERSLRV